MNTFGWLMISRVILALSILSTGWMALQVTMNQASALSLVPAVALVLIATYAHGSCLRKHRQTEADEDAAERDRQQMQAGVVKSARHLRLVPHHEDKA